MSLDRAILTVWIIVGVIWLAASGSLKSMARAEPLGSRVFHILELALAFLLLFDSRAERPRLECPICS